MRPLLHGEFDLVIDEKNRLLVPSEIRKLIGPEQGEGFFQIIGVNRKIWFYPVTVYEQLATEAPPEMIPDEGQLAFDQLTFAMANRLLWDKQGRILMPDKTLKRAGVNKEVSLIGARNHLELWNRDEWDTRREELFQKSQEISLRAKQRPT